jgi:PBSX family phage portal protein
MASAETTQPQPPDDAPTRPKVPTLKAAVIGDIHAPSSTQDETQPTSTVFSNAGVIEPVWAPEELLRHWENSSSLNQNIQAYATNIDGLGHRYTPRVDLIGEDATQKISDAMWVENIRRREREQHPGLSSGEGEDGPDQGEPPEALDICDLTPTADDVAEKIAALQAQQRLERARLENFFDLVNPTGSFEALRKQTRQDLEITGNAYWEVLRNKRGEIARFILVPPTSVRCTALDEHSTKITERVRVGLGWDVVDQPRFFRRYIQKIGNTGVWFKEYGDPRVVSQKNGKVYANLAEFQKKCVSKDVPANEIVHFKIHRTGEPYGVPRWIGALLAVLGSRAADEVNVTYFDNKAIPPLALLVSGGRLDDDSVERISNYVKDTIKGRENFHNILVIQVDDADGDPYSMDQGNPKIAFEKLIDAQQGDALFQKYDERNIDKVGSSFRMPRLLRGDVRDFNKGTAQTSLQFADEQVFDPERREFDSWINRVILPALGILLWDFRSLGPQTRDPDKFAKIVVDLVKVGVVTPNEARGLASDVTGRELDPIAAVWANQPLQLTLAGFVPDGGGDKGTAGVDLDPDEILDKALGEPGWSLSEKDEVGSGEQMDLKEFLKQGSEGVEDA